MWWFTPIITALKRLREENHKFEASPGKIGETLTQQQNAK
jgi:hypothetical protein